MKDDSKKIFIIVVIVLCIFMWKQSVKIKDLERQNTRLESDVSDYEYALDNANEQIDEANNIIEDAKAYAWESYDDMGYTLESLDTVENVSI